MFHASCLSLVIKLFFRSFDPPSFSVLDSDLLLKDPFELFVECYYGFVNCSNPALDLRTLLNMTFQLAIMQGLLGINDDIVAERFVLAAASSDLSPHPDVLTRRLILTLIPSKLFNFHLPLIFVVRAMS